LQLLKKKIKVSLFNLLGEFIIQIPFISFYFEYFDNCKMYFSSTIFTEILLKSGMAFNTITLPYYSSTIK
jgi:hypothetical protein